MTTTLQHHTAVAVPTLVDARACLRRCLGEDFDSIWCQACAAADIDVTADDADDAHADVLVDRLSAHDGASRAALMSWRIRRRAARNLAALAR